MTKNYESIRISYQVTCLAIDLLSALLYTFLIFARVNCDIALAFNPNTTLSSDTSEGSGSEAASFNRKLTHFLTKVVSKIQLLFTW